MGARDWQIAPPPHGGIDHITLRPKTLGKGTCFYRVQPVGKGEAYFFGHSPENRMSSAHDPPRYRECYCALDDEVCVHERVFWNPSKTFFAEDDFAALEVTSFEATAALEVLRVDHRSCAALGIDLSIFTARDVGLSRAWAGALECWRDGALDGLVFPARSGGGKAVALFDRAEPRLGSRPERTPLLEWRNRHGERLDEIVEARLGAIWIPRDGFP